MNITIIIGWVIAFGMVVFGIFQGGQIDWFIDPPSLAITIGGTIGCLIASYPLSYLAGLGSASSWCSCRRSSTLKST